MKKTNQEILHDDAEMLHKFGYAQELRRRMSSFGNFAMSFMVIGMFWCACVNIQQGIGTAGMFGISVAWLIGSAIAVSTALSLAEIASAIPTAGGLYHWSTVFGGRGWGWATAWLNLLAYTFSVGGTATATYLLFQQMVLGWVLHIDTSHWGYWHQLAGVSIIVVSQATLNHVGVRTLTRLGEFGAYVTFFATVALLAVLLYNIHPANFAHMLTYTNNTGDAGGDVVPYTKNPIQVLGYAVLLPMWIITSYDAAAHTSEETVDAVHSVPKAMINAALLSAIMGVAIFTALAMAMGDPAYIIKQGGNAFSVLFSQATAPVFVKDFISVALVLASYICGACSLTGFSRALYAFARDRGLPSVLRKVSHRFRTPAVAIWCGGAVGVAVTLYSSAFAALAAGTALFYQLSYGMAIAAALLSRKRVYGPFRLGIWSKILGIIGIAGGAFIIWVGLQPPTQILQHYFIVIFILLALGWFGLERKRFPGPPVGEYLIAARQREILAEEQAVGEAG